MELSEALRTTGAIREFTDQPVSEDTLHEIIDTARFAPSGGNRQGWRMVLIRDAETRQRIRDLYLPGWYEYLAQGRAGLVAWAPTNDRAAEGEALQQVPQVAAASASAGGMAEHLDRVPALLVVLADLRALAATDRDRYDYTLVGGASVYPFCWSVLLAAREHGLGGVMTTMLARRDPEVRATLGAPDHYRVAAGLVLGYPVRRPSRLRRAEVDDFVTVDRIDGRPLRSPAPA